MEKLYADENIKITLDRSKKLLAYEWKKFIPEQAYKDSLEIVYKTICDHDVEKCLMDLRKLSVIPRGAKSWMEHTWLPRVKAQGVVKIAIISVPPTIQAHYLLYVEQQELLTRN